MEKVSNGLVRGRSNIWPPCAHFPGTTHHNAVLFPLAPCKTTFTAQLVGATLKLPIKTSHA